MTIQSVTEHQHPTHHTPISSCTHNTHIDYEIPFSKHFKHLTYFTDDDTTIRSGHLEYPAVDLLRPLLLDSWSETLHITITNCNCGSIIFYTYNHHHLNWQQKADQLWETYVDFFTVWCYLTFVFSLLHSLLLITNLGLGGAGQRWGVRPAPSCHRQHQILHNKVWSINIWNIHTCNNIVEWSRDWLSRNLLQTADYLT